MTDTCLDIITQLTVELHKDDTSKEKLGKAFFISIGNCLERYMF